MKKEKRQAKPKEGDVFAVPLGDKTFGFGQICALKSYAYFDLRSDKFPSLEEIVSHPVIFRVPMMQDAIKEGGWIILGNLPLKGALAEPGIFWTQAVGSNNLRIYQANTFTPATPDQIKGLELLAWWYEHQIVERLLDHFAGRSNQIAEFFRKIKVYDPITGKEIKT